MTQGLNDLFGNKDTILEEVIILPVGYHAAGTYDLPAGYTWEDFVEVEVALGITSIAAVYDTQTLTSELVGAVNNTERLCRLNYTDGAVDYQVDITKESATSFKTTRIDGADSCIRYIKGYTKRYATRNISAIIDAGTMGTSETNTFDIATHLGEDYVGRDIFVEAEMWTGSEWINPYWYSDYFSGASRGIGARASRNLTKGVVGISTGGVGLLVASNAASCNREQGTLLTENPANTTSAPMRILVWKIDQYITPTSKGGAGKTVLYDGVGVQNGKIVLTGGNTDQFDDIEFHMTWSGSAGEPISSRIEAQCTVDASGLLDNSKAGVQSLFRSDSISSSFLVQSLIRGESTSSSLDVWLNTSGYYGYGIHKVVGINYQ